MTKSFSVSYDGFSLVRTWEVQKPPYKHSLDYHFEKRERTRQIYEGSLGPRDSGGPDFGTGIRPTNALNTAYGRLQDSIGDKSQWANNLLEVHENFNMIASAAASLTSVAKAIRKGDVGGVVKGLGLTSNADKNAARRAVTGGRSFGNKWLALHFGIVPTIQDIGSAVQHIQKPDFGSRTVHGAHSDHYHDVLIDIANSFGHTRQTQDITYSCRMAMRCRVSNPNAFLANQLGFVNPVSVLWEAVPYSFVVDWFSNVGQVLSAATDMVGISSDDAYTTTCQMGTNSWFNLQRENKQFQIPYGFQATDGKSIYITRVPHLEGPSLSVKPFKGFSVTRAATAISLLLQHL